MTEFENIKIIPAQCEQELNDLSELLESGTNLKERDVILPFFQSRKHLSAYIGTLITKMFPNKLAFEYEIFGDFKADLVIGDTENNIYVFVEFEPGTSEIFRKKPSKNTLEWSSHYEAGFSQLIDWFFALDQLKNTAKYKGMFHPAHDEPPTFWPLLIACRGTSMEYYEKIRLKWRTDKVLIDSKSVLSLTYDLLGQQLYERIKLESKYWSSA